VLEIQRMSTEDGPGNRTTVFFKGCTLACAWCHNPESISPQAQKMFTAARCIGCGECGKTCPPQACTLTPQGIVTNPQRCELCGACARVCPSRATEISGRSYAIPELLTLIEKERPQFDQSGGGVTLSGGEPLLYAEFISELLDRCGERGIHRTVDTSGYVAGETLLRVARRTDLFLYDLKLIDAEQHRKWAGVDNRLILTNLQTLAATGAHIQIRIPLIPGVNADRRNLDASAAFIAHLGGEKKTVNLLPCHAIATHKHAKLGADYRANDLREPRPDELELARDCFAARGLDVVVGG
jgi:pyruvate formate lyase activating enzyme